MFLTYVIKGKKGSIPIFHISGHLDEMGDLDVELTFSCPCCPNKFSSIFDLRMHLSIDNHKNFKAQLFALSLMNSIKRDIHGSKQSQKQSDSKENTIISQDQKFDINLHQKRFVCNECGKQFKHKKTLIYHIKRKNSIYDYSCSKCDFKAIKICDLKIHQVKTHTKLFPYICSKCGEGFLSQCYLKDHTAQHSGEKRFECNFCEKKFQSKSNYKRHSRIHFNIKPYECTMCSKKFYRHSSLCVHIKIH